MKVSKKDIIYNYLGTIMTLGSNLVILPFAMRLLDDDALGLWYVFLSVGSIVLLFDFGFSPALSRNIAYAWTGVSSLTKDGTSFSKDNDVNIPLVKKILGVCKRIYLLISVAALAILLTVGSLYILGLTKEIEDDTYIYGWLIYSFAVFLNLYYGYYTTFLKGTGNISQYNKANIISRVTQIVISIVFLYLKFGLIALASAYLINGFVFRLLSKKYFYSYENLGTRLRSDKSIIEKKDFTNTFKIIWHNAWKDGVVSISKYLSSQATTVVSSYFLTLSETGIYSISLQLVSAIASMSTSLYSAYQPSLQSCYASQKKEESKRILSLAMCSYFYIFIIGMLGLVFLGRPLLKIIKPNAIFDAGVILVLGIYLFLFNRHSCYCSFISNTNHIPYMIPYVISSFVGVIISVVLMIFFNVGIFGIILGPLLAQLAYNNWKWPSYVHKELDVNSISILKNGTREIKVLLRKFFNKKSCD